MWRLAEVGPEQFVENCQECSADFWRKICEEKGLLFYTATWVLSENQRLHQNNGAIHCVLQNYQKTAVNIFIFYALFCTPLAYRSVDLLCIRALLLMNPKSLKNRCIDLISIRFKFFLLSSGNWTQRIQSLKALSTEISPLFSLAEN